MRRGDWRTDVVVVLCAALVPIGVGAVQSAERVIYVDAAATGGNDGSSWADAYRDLQDALADANEAPPAVIRVAQGTYRPGPALDATREPRDATFRLHNHVRLEGGYVGVAGTDPNTRDVNGCRTILSGDLAGDDDPDGDWYSPDREEDCWVVVDASETDETAVIDGFTVTRAAKHAMRVQSGSPRIHRCRIVDNAQAGIYTWYCNSVLTECVFERNGNRPSTPGATEHVVLFHIGAAMDGTHNNLRLADCAFAENRWRAISNHGTLDLLRCSFVANTGAQPSGILFYGDLTARKCSFTNNRYTAIQCWPNATLIDCEFTRNSGGESGAIRGNGSLTLVGCEFIGNWAHQIGAVTMYGDMLKAHNCVFAGNYGLYRSGAIITYATAVVRLSNCTFIGNRGRLSSIAYITESALTPIELTRCIVWDGPDPFSACGKSLAGPPVVTYSNVQGGYPGEGNIDVDPLFVDPGHWDPNDTPDDPDDDVYVVGDYHLKSQAGHWDRATETWVFDEVTSPCIDAGDPNAPLGAEPFPNGGYVNLGACGGSLEASRSYFGEPVCETHIAGDINGDCKVDDLDMDILMSHWLMPDIGKANIPPTIRLISPAEGDEFAKGTPMLFRAEASDPDGTVVCVEYSLRRRGTRATEITYSKMGDPDDDWMVTWEWWRNVTVYPDRIYTVMVKAIDNDGAIAATPEIEITLLP